MASINIVPEISGARKRKTKRRLHSLRIDMTPMVDLGFLLISFFVMTIELSRPSMVSLAMPKEGPPTTLGESHALSLLIYGENQLNYYHGDWEKAVKSNAVYATSFDIKQGLGKIIREKQVALGAARNELMLLIKPGPRAGYRQVVDALDEAIINQVKKYAVLKPAPEEAAYRKQQ
ncbi:MAG TPA: biopolymer transporter ExbD [Chitinophagaceae bacterium]|nr:biopolymer transporter ExbD [Chitinophagaceae bacterium]